MSNLTVGGYDSFARGIFPTTKRSRAAPARRPAIPAPSGIHTHMTNTLNTPIEALEAYYPMRVTEYRMRRGSGGRGAVAGGDGLVRELRMPGASDTEPADRAAYHAPWGLAGGGPGKAGANYLVRDGRRIKLPGKANEHLAAGERMRIETPGGGGWGRASRGPIRPL